MRRRSVVDDQLVLDRVARGEVEAFVGVYDDVGDEAYRLARLVVDDPDVACRIVADAFVSFWRSAPVLANIGSTRILLLADAHARARRVRPSSWRLR